VGNALVDIEARVSEQTLAELQFAKGLMTLVDEDTQRRVLEALQGVKTSRCAGGSAANTIVGVADFGGKSAYAGKVSDDEIGRFFLEDMRKVGVAIEVPPGEGDSGTCVILITPDAERTMLTHLGVSATIGPGDIDEAEVKQAKYLYVEGYLFAGATTRQAALRAIELAKKHGVKVAFTVSDPFLIKHHRDEFLELIAGSVDLLFCNLDEARALTTFDDPIECAHQLHDATANVALTLGADGSILMHEGQAIPIEGVPVEAVDTTGAGDMYAAGVLYGITNGLSWKQSGRLGSHAAARIVGQLGARLRRKFTADEMRQLLE
jgi:sugar/nucleoside kinase (ribokinase family)